MNILIATPLYPPDIGGPATYSKILEDELPKRGIGVSMLAFSEVRRFPKGISHLAYFLLALFRGRGCDIVYAQDPVSVGLPAMCAAKLLRKRFIVKVVGDFAWEQYQTGSWKLGIGNWKNVSLEEFQNQDFDFLTNIRKKIERYVAGRAEQVIVPSEYLKKIVSMWFVSTDTNIDGKRDGILQPKINRIYNAFPPVCVSERRDDLKKELGIEGPVIMAAGRLVPWKGMGTLLEIFPHLVTIRPGLILVIIGDGPERKRLEALAETAGMSGTGRIVFTGELLHHDVLRYVKAADVFINNSSYEGLSHHLLEAMAVGTPIVATNVGGNPELIRDGENGFLVQYGDAEELRKKILALLDISDLQRVFAKSGKEKAGSFTRERMIEELIGILKQDATLPRGQSH